MIDQIGDFLDLFDFDDSDDCSRGDFDSARQRKGKI